MTPAADELTITTAVQQYRISRKTIRRHLAEGGLAGARQRRGDAGPEWVFPASSLEALGYERRAGAEAVAGAAVEGGGDGREEPPKGPHPGAGVGPVSA